VSLSLILFAGLPALLLLRAVGGLTPPQGRRARGGDPVAARLRRPAA
jgi:hypothetical protein